MPKETKTTHAPSIDIVEGHLTQIKKLQAEPQKLFAMFAFAKKYATRFGSKVKRARPNESSIIVNSNGVEMSPNDLGYDEMPAFSHSVINHEGKFYVLMEGTIFYNEGSNPEDPFNTIRGLRKGKLAINEKGEVFFVKIVEHTLAYHNKHLQDESAPEMLIEHAQGAPHQTVMTRKKEEEDTFKIYSIIPFKGHESFSLVAENKLNPLQTMYLAVQYMLLVYEIQKMDLVHRDFKPENITAQFGKDDLLDVFIIDWGMARKLESIAYNGVTYKGFKETDYLCGTENYLSPTIRSNAVYNCATDMYAAAKSATMILAPLKYNIKHSILVIDSDTKQTFYNILQLANNIINYINDSDLQSIPIINEEFIKSDLNHLQNAIIQLNKKNWANLLESPPPPPPPEIISKFSPISLNEYFDPSPVINPPQKKSTTALQRAAEDIVLPVKPSDMINLTIECLKSIHSEQPVSSIINNLKQTIEENKGDLTDIAAAAIFFHALLDENIGDLCFDFDSETQMLYCNLYQFIRKINDQTLSDEEISKTLAAGFKTESSEQFVEIKEVDRPISPLRSLSMFRISSTSSTEYNQERKKQRQSSGLDASNQSNEECKAYQHLQNSSL